MEESNILKDNINNNRKLIYYIFAIFILIVLGFVYKGQFYKNSKYSNLKAISGTCVFNSLDQLCPLGGTPFSLVVRNNPISLQVVDLVDSYGIYNIPSISELEYADKVKNYKIHFLLNSSGILEINFNDLLFSELTINTTLAIDLNNMDVLGGYSLKKGGPGPTNLTIIDKNFNEKDVNIEKKIIPHYQEGYSDIEFNSLNINGKEYGKFDFDGQMNCVPELSSCFSNFYESLGFFDNYKFIKFNPKISYPILDGSGAVGRLIESNPSTILVEL